MEVQYIYSGPSTDPPGCARHSPKLFIHSTNVPTASNNTSGSLTFPYLLLCMVLASDFQPNSQTVDALLQLLTELYLIQNQDDLTGESHSSSPANPAAPHLGHKLSAHRASSLESMAKQTRQHQLLHSHQLLPPVPSDHQNQRKRMDFSGTS